MQTGVVHRFRSLYEATQKLRCSRNTLYNGYRRAVRKAGGDGVTVEFWIHNVRVEVFPRGKGGVK